MGQSEETKLALVQQEIGSMKTMFSELSEAIKELTMTLKAEYVTRKEIILMERIVYGGASIVLATVLAAGLYLVIRQP